MKKKVTYLILIFTLLLNLSAYAVYQPNPNRWQWVCSNSLNGYFFDKQSISRTSTGISDWIMIVYTPEGVQDEVNTLGYQVNNLAFTLQRISLNYNYFRIDSIYHYDARGNLLLYRDYKNSSSFPIIPNTKAEKMRNALYNFRQ